MNIQTILLPALRQIRSEAPLVHCVTNPISIGNCANLVLCLGASPIMAEHPEETAEITAQARALLLNLGNLTQARAQAMRNSAASARERGLPCVLDLVGVGCSRLRLDLAEDLIRTARPALLKGNESEIRAMCGLPHHAKGIDSGERGDLAEAARAVALAAEKYGCAVLLSGAADVIAGGGKTLAAENGHPIMARVTGTGCMLGAAAAVLLTALPPLEGAAAAACLMGAAGEHAARRYREDLRISQVPGHMLDALDRFEALDLAAGLRCRTL